MPLNAVEIPLNAVQMPFKYRSNTVQIPLSYFPNAGTEDQLYALTSDGAEQTNVAGSQAGRLAELKAVMDTHPPLFTIYGRITLDSTPWSRP